MLTQEDAFDYERLKAALLHRYNCRKQGYRQRFREAKPEDAENYDQFIVRLRNYFTQWVKLSDVESSFEGVVQLMVKKQFINSCSKKLSVHLMERKPQSSDCNFRKSKFFQGRPIFVLPHTGCRALNQTITKQLFLTPNA